MANVEHLTEQTFKVKVFDFDTNKEWKYTGTLPCIVDFYANWCGPCRAVAPILEELQKEFAGKLYIYKVNTDEQQRLSSVFGIQSIPSLLFVPLQGQPQMSMGAMDKTSFKKVIAEVLNVK